ncbi:syx-7 [Pristionchus pacificus]|uniref:Syx-7 n=1 Tax=Pristionchus pacificus TaxID=54126 RepID=A0A2A6BGQ1_PRIPA|nr:syx-7 [Pristionchus pacificus]|eukprot:PDM65057.1 syx-7 [Pristionchus pacificus]
MSEGEESSTSKSSKLRRNYYTFPSAMDFDRENNADAIVAAVRTSIQKLSGQVRDIEQWAQRLGGDDGERTREHFNELANDANRLAKDTNRQMQQLVQIANTDGEIYRRSRMALLTESEKNESWVIDEVKREFRSIRVQRDRLSDEFMQILNRLQAAQRSAERAQKEGMKRVRYTQEQEEEEAMRRAEAASFDAQRHTQLQRQQQANVREMKERTEALQELERDIADVQTIFTDLARIVHDQGEMVESIEENVDQAQIRVEQGATQLQQAVYYNNAARKKKLMIFVFFCVLLLIIGLTVYFSFN